MKTHHILLADDDIDDYLLFKMALDELPLYVNLMAARNSEQLMQLLNSNEQLPDMLFLDPNMANKSGFECLGEIKQNERLKQLPVIIISTSFEQDILDLLYKNGAQYYIRKPNEYSHLLKVIHHAIMLTSQLNLSQPPKEQFVLHLNF